MEFLSPTISVSPQLYLQDIAALQEAGVRLIICHRPDGEEAEQPAYAVIEAAAANAGIAAAFVPVSGGEFSEQAIAQTKALLAKGERTHMYCRSGTRSTIIWAAAEAETGRNLNDIIDTAAAAGYGIGQLHAFLAARQP